MFIRRERKVLAGGVQRTYLALAHNVRETLSDGSSRTKPIVYARLGPEDELEEGMVLGMRDALDRYLEQRFGRKPPTREQSESLAKEVRAKAPALRILASRAYGMRVIVEQVWKELGFAKALSAVERQRAITFSLERIVFAMVLNRLVDPGSKRACNEWIANEAFFPEAVGMDVQHFYRALDLLDEHEEAVLEAIGRAAREQVSSSELTTLLIDTTTTYVESDYDDEERKQIAEEWLHYWENGGERPEVPPPQVVNDPPLRMRGHSKDKRPREPQIKIGLVSTVAQQVVDLQIWAGNTSDQKMTVGLLQAAQARLGSSRLVAVMDSGMGGNENLKAIDALDHPPERVSAVPLRNSKVAESELLTRPGRWAEHPYRGDFKVRSALLDERTSPSGRPELWVATRNETEASRQRRLLDKEVARVKEALAEDARVDGHGRPVCKLLANHKRRRFVKRNASGTRYILDRDRIRIEYRRAGVHVVRSTLIDDPVELTLRAYDAQYGVEAQFRALKSPLKLRPMHHRKDKRIRAHVLMCGLALAVMRELERRTGHTLEELHKIIGRTRAMKVQRGQTEFWQREEWSSEAIAVLEAVGAPQGPATWGARRVQA